MTAFLPTTMTVSKPEIIAALNTARALKAESLTWDGAEILGVHAEGPFINPGKKGAQAEENILINIKKKEENHEMMSREMMKLLSVISRENLYSLKHNRTNYRPQEKMTLPRWI